ncbi:transmembrane protein, putative [Medicago truncatula]|uniref:Transmembrane protein, putative n=1 Tax=Medicago truncatula TaxID=3880 RepID=G7KQ51_MEDTR|nr:transmembrane protein, putative [Medicago truncatula]
MNGHMVGWPWLSLIIILATLLTARKNHWGKHDLTVGHTLDIVGSGGGGSIAAHIKILGIVLSGEILLGQLMRTNH